MQYFGRSTSASCAGRCQIPDSPIQIDAVAARSLADKRVVYPSNFKWDEAAAPGMLTHDRLFVSGMTGMIPPRQGSG